MYEINREAGIFYITMEYVSGQDLKGLLRQTGQLTIESALSIARQACLGLSEAHRLGVVHRDLKPSNIMVDREGNVRIIDFGIARSLENSALALEGDFIGTPGYISPEQAQGGEIDHRADIYSLGSIIFQMLTGRLPFADTNPVDQVRMHISALPPDPRKINPLIPEYLGRVILKCLEKEKEKRYQSTHELFAALETPAHSGWAAERPPLEHPAQWWSTPQRSISRGRCPAG
jgi:serine/threonine-protein kinase